MTPARWEQVDQLFHAALKIEPSERTIFLAEACAGDEGLQREVESLLSSHGVSDTFFETPAADVAAELLSAHEFTFAPGQQIEHYRIARRIGTGGMGEVYLAEDLRLNRKIALKLLPTKFTIDAQRVHRFEQEARAASALNHPNIVTIHEIGRIDKTQFIVTEFVEGQTLRDRMITGPISPREVLEIAIQVAGALEAAHAAGIVHRDIKPENIMIRADGYVKVLDFGLAKLTEQRIAPVDPEAETRAHLKTDPGMVMGTVQYMSPEQARGRGTDARTDLWSLGVVLYEMVSGHVPFEGETPSHVVVSILESEPPALAVPSGELPAELERIVSKSLRKKREERYQTAKDLLIDLRRLRQQVDVAAAMEPLYLQQANEATASATAGARAVRTRETSKESTDQGAARTASSVEYLISQIRANKVVALGGVIILFAAVGFGWYKFGRSRSPLKPTGSFQSMNMKPLTTTGKATFAAISPDGRYEVHVVDDGAQQSLWMRQVATFSEAHQIIPPGDVHYRGLTFSPDGNYLYYVGGKNADNDLYQVPVLGGTPKRLLKDIDSPVTFSPDGRHFAFDRGDPKQTEGALLVANADGTEELELARRSNAIWRPAWSPNGRVIAALGPGGQSVVEVNVDDGTTRPIGTMRWWRIEQMVWLSDGRGLVMVAKDEESSPTQIWQLSFPGGEARRITNDLDDYSSLSLTADSTSLAAVKTAQHSNIWIVASGDASRAVQITSTNLDGPGGISWTPDGRVVYQSRASGNSDLWIMDADGRNQKQLTADAPHDVHPVVSADGTYVVFHSNRAGHNNVWRIDIDGSNLKQLTNGPGEQLADSSPDGNWLVYTSVGVGSKRRVWKVPIYGGNPVQVTAQPSFGPSVSPDGKLIACNYYDDETGWTVAVIPFDGGEPTKIFDKSLSVSFTPYQWMPNGQALSYVDRGVSSRILSLPVAEQKSPEELMDFKSGRIFNFAWSRDGKRLAVARGEVISDAVLITNFRD